MSYSEIEHAYHSDIKASVNDTCLYVRNYVRSLEADRSCCNDGWGKWNAIQTTTWICYNFYSSAKKIISGFTDNCVVDLGNLAQTYLGDLSELGLLHAPTNDDIDLMAKVRAFEIMIAELTRVYLKQLRGHKRALNKRKFGLQESDVSYLTYKIDQAKKVNKHMKGLYN